jgi:nucleotide-binding universal stress UspA family protein
MDEAFDLITIGSRGMGGGKGWILGSVSSRVIEEAPCPLLVVK